MMRKILAVAVLSALLFSVAPVFADSHKGISFVCPVLGGRAGENGNSDKQPFAVIGGGDITVIGPVVYVPMHATNQNGAGTPPGAHAVPGEDGYTAIWWGPPP
jgi:hypothetical protein